MTSWFSARKINIKIQELAQQPLHHFSTTLQVCTLLATKWHNPTRNMSINPAGWHPLWLYLKAVDLSQQLIVGMI